MRILSVILLLCIPLSAVEYITPFPVQSRFVAGTDEIFNIFKESHILHCLTTVIYGEARGESRTGKIAVAYTVINRAKSNDDICNVILAPYQYSVFNDSKLRKIINNTDSLPKFKHATDINSWNESKMVAKLVYKRLVEDPTKGATHYYSPKCLKFQKYRKPKWSFKFTLVSVIDNHRFYKG